MANSKMKTSANIDHLRIATPCPISWDQMTGDNRVRFCDHCHLNVYNISALSRFEAERLIAATEGRLCARLFRRADGTVLTKDCPVGLRALRRRVAKRTAAIFAAIVSLSGAAFGQESSSQDKSAGPVQTKITRTSVSDQTGTSLAVTVTDVVGAVIPDAKTTAFHDSLKRSFQSFGSSVLSDREQQVAHLLLRGNCAKAVARILEISPDTARNHSKRIYRKLSVTSQAELLALFFRALEQVEPGQEGDPLARLVHAA